MKLLIIYLLFACSSVLAYNDSLVFSFYSLKNMNAPIDYRKNVFSAVFGDSVFEQNALFIFYERLGAQRLYVWNDESHEKKLFVYQLPETRMLPWLHPEEYMEKRNQLLKQKISVEKCKKEISSEEPLVADLLTLHVDEHLFLELQKSCGQLLDHLIMGYSQKNGKYRYFYYVKQDCFEKMKESRFSVYANVFRVMEKMDEKITFPECR